jgi:hypothetical protein
MALRRSPAGAFTAAAEDSAQLVHDQRRQRFPVHILGNDEQRNGLLRQLLQDRQ